MELNIQTIDKHCQLTEDSCIPMAVECILKLNKLIPPGDLSLQMDTSKSGTSDWIAKGFTFPPVDPKVRFKREFMLSDLGTGLPDRGDHFMKDYYEPLFKRIDQELSEGRFVYISLDSGVNLWHMEVIYNKINDDEYQTVTFYHPTQGPQGPQLLEQNLRERVSRMKGTDIVTYELI